MNFFRKKIATACLFLLPILLFSQERTQSVNISLLKENTPTSFNNLINPFIQPLHYGGFITYEWKRKSDSYYAFSHGVQFGYYRHSQLHQNLFLMWKPKFEWTFRNKLNFKLLTGIGYAHTFPTQETYQLENGEYKRKTNFGKPHAAVSVGYGLGYNLTSEVEFFIHSELMFLLPYAPKGIIPFYLSSNFSAGFKIYLNK
ncbi:MAG: hypothetical protein AB8F94_08715 [Saprospiraceae bacterium]